jgi:hypothetical protein
VDTTAGVCLAANSVRTRKRADQPAAGQHGDADGDGDEQDGTGHDDDPDVLQVDR